MKQFKLLAQGHPRLRIRFRWPWFSVFTCSVSVSFLPWVPFFQKQPTPMLCSLLGTVSQGVMPSSAQKQVGDQGHSILWVRILKGTAQWWLGPIHSCDCCTRNGLICSCIPHSQGHSAPALAEGCSFRLPLWAVSFPSAQGGRCGGVPSDPSPGPQWRWPWWLTAKAFPVLALSYTELPHLV